MVGTQPTDVVRIAESLAQGKRKGRLARANRTFRS